MTNAPTAAPAAAKTAGRTGVSLIAEAFRRCRGAIISVAGFSLFINLLMLTGPLFMMQVYDRVLASRSVSTLVALMLLVGILYAFMIMLELVRSRVLVRVGRRLDENLKERVFDAIVEQGLRRTRVLGSQPVRDLESLRQFIGGQGLFALFDAPWSPIYFAVIFMLHPVLGWFSVGAGLILFVLAVLNEMMIRAPLAEANKAAQASGVLAEDSRRNAEVIAAMGMRSGIGRRWSERHGQALDFQTRASDRGGLISGLTKSLRLLFQSAILALGAYLVIRQELSAGSLIAASIIMSRALAPVEQAISHWQAFLGARRAFGRLHSLLEDLGDRTEPMPLPQPSKTLSVEQLVAFVPGVERPLLRGLQFSLERGQGLGVIGPTGAGKSTLARVLVGVWPHMRGTVRLDGASLDNWSEAARGSFIGYLPQDVDLFAGTIGHNIARFDPNADPAKIVAAAQRADVHDMILAMPQGYDTPVGTGGVRLSGGQRQRIALARALYGDPALIVLDEPNSNLDSEGEVALVKAIEAARAAGAIVVVIAHRPSAIHAVDMLLFLRDGQQEAFGPKEEVLRKTVKSAPPAPAAGLQVVGETA
ncbi:type I secretion system permease/ATPase [Dongia sedimenti]|uniref:Type I secretion system permease/ATPase n=1 Tax=Dongia sedimenti TaxID=3064282 RepID=A0ABU0YRH8_9PROT|nr:type I secretion system permease/ATPase [Rhodospirillaceae bacterium R-7]